MKLSVKFILLTMTIAMLNLASGNESIGKPIVIVAPQLIATPNVQARVKHKRIVKSKVQRAVPFGMDDSEDVDQSNDLATGYRRRDLNKIAHEDEPLSDYVMSRLAQARELAMAAYRKAHA
jgi:hypothetical protein